jgi:hypothetical protein
LFHSLERLSQRLDLFAVPGPVARALRLDRALVVGLRFVGKCRKLR